MNLRFPESVIVVAALLLAGSSPASLAQLVTIPTQTRLAVAGSTSYVQVFGKPPVQLVTVRYQKTDPCPPFGPTDLPGDIILKRDGRVATAATQSINTCRDGARESTAYLQDSYSVPFGTHEYVADFIGYGDLQASRSNPVTLTVLPEFTGSTSAGTMQAGIVDPRAAAPFGSWQCTPSASLGMRREVLFSPTTSAPQPPAGRGAYGYVNYDVSCSWYCDFNECPLPPAKPTILRMLVGLPDDAPPSTQVWAYQPSNANATPRWAPVSAMISGRFVEVDLVGDMWPNGPCCLGTSSVSRITGSLALIVNQTLPPDHDFADMWWSGPEENGWGLSIAQLGDRMHLVLFVYDGNGNPTWYIVPQGAWDAARSYFRGDIQAPSDRTGMGTVVGSATLSFDTVGSGRLDYTIHGASGSKALARMPIAGSASSSFGRFAGPWWKGDARGGWGVKIHQQGDTLFTIWYAGDANYDPVWYVMPGGRWSGKSYAGPLYRTHGSPWIGTTYDASRLTLMPVGTMTLGFANENEATMSYVLEGVAGEERLVRQPF